MSEDAAAEAHAVLEAADDNYDGKIISQAALPAQPGAFASRLRASLATWAGSGRVRGVWLKLGLDQAALIPLAVEQGFVFHHAERDYVMMTRWLPTDTPSTLPANASHQVGVGAFVVNSAGQVLVVQERSGVLRGRGVWKMPTGLVAAGEDLTEAAERELLEETGITARVESVLALRQAHGFAFGKSDLFVVLGMRPVPDVQVPVPCQSELEDARWVPLAEYTRQPFFAGMPLYSKLLQRCAAWAEGRYTGLKAERLDSSVTRQRSDLLLWGEDDDTLAEARAALQPAQVGSKAAGASGSGQGDGEAAAGPDAAGGSRL
ncbi:hypothetical protein HYH02_013146 [Chlamydomonas schloesseri]|uniref:Nudix hydrolase domain-containing protein n=1 Tax=Chlamydomonas schloesseri TaxID=2026947 RepID=A0A835SUT0_9CHLO|nr:hypothetical protein HYH02_013146 [Chlamydomonas schloesseri]|eukprot:KAG2431927.1 hypothetical protein HYH02_013146 [Chlamydomonas schloesseri]